MNYDKAKVDEFVLALMYLTSFGEHTHFRSWKSQDWETLDRLHEKGLISNPKNKSKSVVFSEEGFEKSKEHFLKHFGIKEQ